jgi:hypothetical protein
MGEQRVLAQERALKAAAGADAEVSSTYHYTTGPDGRRYITSAEVTVKGDEAALGRTPGGVRHIEPKAPEQGGVANAEQSSSEERVLAELRATEREVIAHEAAHKAAAGRFGGAVSYTYTRGPDGRSYITGGEVPIHVPPSSDPEKTLRDMEQVQRAAMAPGDPSSQDRSVAAKAAASAAQARREIAAESQPTPYVADDEKTTVSTNMMDAISAYKRSASPLGMWALGRGFERGSGYGYARHALSIAA